MKEEGIPLGNWVEDQIDRSGPKGTANFVYVDISSIDRLLKRISEPKELATENAPSRARQVLRAGDVLVSMTRPNLNAVAMVPQHLDGSIGSTGFHVLRPKHADPSFLYFAVQTREFIDAMSMKVQGALYPAVRPHDISAFCLPPFALARQRQIVAKIEELFSELDAGEESLRTALRKLGVYRQSLLKQAFEGKLTERWRERNPDLQFSTVESAVTSDLLPLGWRYTTLGITIENPAYGTSKKCSYESGGLGVLRIPNIVKGAIDAADLKYAEFTNDEGASYELKPGDLLLIRSNGSVSIVGRCALVEAKHTGLLYAGYLIRLRPIKSLIDPLFLRTQLESLKLRSQIESSAKSTSGVNNINSKEIQRLVIALPSLPEQQETVRLLDEQFTVIDQNEREIAAALKRSEALRQSILKKAFAGQLVPQNPTDEPASALLERIRKERENPIETGRASKK